MVGSVVSEEETSTGDRLPFRAPISKKPIKVQSRHKAQTA